MERSRVSFDRTNDSNLPADPDPVGTESMEEAAQRVLFSNSLEEKLRPANLTPEGEPKAQKNPAIALSKIEPGRPDSLRFASSNQARPSFPASPGLVNEKNRGVLLHFFANHELLAAELMALALLKFPDAPTAFRRGLMQTLQEEQRHTRWYMNRLRKCGVEFGEYPVNRYFWDSVSEMESPLDYVSRLSLTFEQANLDYAKHYSEVLLQAGDPDSAAILNRIYRDEISHVSYGLHWFRKWKDPEVSDWDALHRQLPFPLSPSRAKGNGTLFNSAGRSEAGFDEDYIRQLAVFERSNGRTPNVFFFNPETENRIAMHPEVYHPNARILSVIEDLELLAAFLARRDDVLLMRRPPSREHLERLAEAGLVLPEIENLTSDAELPAQSLLRDRKINQFRPWALSPDLSARFQCLQENGPAPDRKLSWKETDRELFSKISQADALPIWFGDGFAIRSNDDLEKAIPYFRSRNCSQILLKRPFSTAGGGMKRLSLEELESLKGGDISSSIKAEGGILLEPRHDRIFDFSVQIEIHKGKAKFVGAVEQVIAPSGAYRGSISVPKFCSGLPESWARILMTEALPLYHQDSPLLEDLERWASAHDYEGPMGIDSYLYQEADGSIRHRPICEVNARYTMGRVAHDLRRQVAPGHGLKLEILKADSVVDDIPAYDLQQGQISSGSLFLTERHNDSRFIAKMTVAKSRQHL